MELLDGAVSMDVGAEYILMILYFQSKYNSKRRVENKILELVADIFFFRTVFYPI